MKIQSKTIGKQFVLIPVLFIYIWVTNLIDTDSFHTVYVLCALLGIVCVFYNYRSNAFVTPKTRLGIVLLAAVFSVATLIANYPLFLPASELLNLFNIVCSLVGGFFLGYHVLLCGVTRLPLPLDNTKRIRPTAFFLLCWGSIAAVFLLYLFFVGYPGYLSTDSINSLKQITSGEFQNDNPFWYTMLIKLCITAGNAVFGEINAAVACYSAVQIIILSGCFAYGLVTLYQVGMPGWCIGAVFAVYTLLPYNITYSITMWKDIIFGGSTLLIVVSLYRILKNIGISKGLNYLVLVVGSVGFCLMRTNGWYSFFVTALVLLLVSYKQNKKLLWIMAVVLIVCWILINPVLSAMNVGQTDFVETLSVPLQQIARVISEGCEIADGDREFLEKIFLLDRVAERYSPEIVDPIKFETICDGGKEFLRENFGEFIRVWLRIGARYPGEYLKAWVELTKGFWNGGYYFWIYLRWTYPESSGIGGFEMDNPVKDVFDALFRYMEKPVIMQPFYSIGLHAWGVVVCFLVCAVRKRKEFILTIPLLVLLVGLWIGTPVYAEYRYAFPVFTSFPVILFATIFSEKEDLCGQSEKI